MCKFFLLINGNGQQQTQCRPFVSTGTEARRYGNCFKFRAGIAVLLHVTGIVCTIAEWMPYQSEDKFQIPPYYYRQ